LISSLNAIQDIDLTSFATFLSISGLVLLSWDIQLNPSHIIFAMAFCSRINSSVGYHVSTAIKIVFSLGPAIRKLEQFLNTKEMYKSFIRNERCPNSEVKISVENLKIMNNSSIEPVNFEAYSKELIVIAGKTGSGKVRLISFN
jgi:ABC-type transport system involved in cytochrome bd biosynthesis fused ATPase/permease subunit